MWQAFSPYLLYASNSNDSAAVAAGLFGMVFFFLIIALSVVIGMATYFVPTIIAYIRKHNLQGVFLVNLLAGWTVVGWVASLVMACLSKPTVIVQNFHGMPPEPPQNELEPDAPATPIS